MFVQARKGKPFQHEGAVHAPDLEMAFVLAKETFTRRFACTSLFVTDTRSVYVSPMTEGNENAYDLIADVPDGVANPETYELFHLLKRGKQHVQGGAVQATSPAHAMAVGKRQLQAKGVLNIWAVRHGDIRFTTEAEQDLWLTLPEKKFRDATEYKGGEKLKNFVEGAG